MAASTLDPDNLPQPDRQLGKGHGTNMLGPGDISDTGSDVQGGIKAIEEDGLDLDRGTSEDSDSHSIDPGSDTADSTGTGESSTAGRNADVELGSDIDVDHVDYINLGEEADTDASAPVRPSPRQQGRQPPSIKQAPER